MILHYKFDYDESAEIEITQTELRCALAEIIADEYVGIIPKENRQKFVEKTKKMIYDYDLEDTYADIYEEELKDYFSNRL